MFFCFCLFVVAFFFSTLVMDIQQVWKKFVDFTGISRTPRKKQKPLARCRIFWLTIKTLIKFNERGKKKALLFNGESSVIPSLCFLGGFAFGRRIRGDMSMLRFLPFLQLIPTTPFSLELLLFIYNRRKLFKSFVCFKRDILNVRP